MAKKSYIGINGVARNVKGCYIGINGVARKITKGYIGINGVARQFYSAAEVFSITVSSADTSKGTVSGTNVFYYTASASAQTINITTTFTPASGYVLKTLTPSAGSISGKVLTIPANTRENITISASWKTSISPTLNDNSWEVIKQAAISGVASNYWSIGAYKNDTINGTVGRLSISGTYRFYIVAFNHNASQEGNNTINFMVRNSSGNDIAFADSMGTSSSPISEENYFSMNATETNSGGWKNCQMRRNICGGAPDVTNGSYTFLNALSSSLRSAIALSKIYSDNVGGGPEEASYITATYEKIYIPSEYEVSGRTDYGNSYESNYQKRFQYYINGNAMRRYHHSSTSTYQAYFCRSPMTNYPQIPSGYIGKRWCRVPIETEGMVTSGAYYSRGFVPCFKIGANAS